MIKVSLNTFLILFGIRKVIDTNDTYGLCQELTDRGFQIADSVDCGDYYKVSFIASVVYFIILILAHISILYIAYIDFNLILPYMFSIWMVMVVFPIILGFVFDKIELKDEYLECSDTN